MMDWERCQALGNPNRFVQAVLDKMKFCRLKLIHSLFHNSGGDFQDKIDCSRPLEAQEKSPMSPNPNSNKYHS